jgi:hypothetical protein
MDKFIVAIVGSVALLIGILAFSLIALAGGAVVGWIAGWAFPATAANIAAATGLATYQWGAIVAFIGSYFRTTVSK